MITSSTSYFFYSFIQKRGHDLDEKELQLQDRETAIRQRELELQSEVQLMHVTHNIMSGLTNRFHLRYLYLHALLSG